MLTLLIINIIIIISFLIIIYSSIKILYLILKTLTCGFLVKHEFLNLIDNFLKKNKYLIYSNFFFSLLYILLNFLTISLNLQLNFIRFFLTVYTGFFFFCFLLLNILFLKYLNYFKKMLHTKILIFFSFSFLIMINVFILILNLVRVDTNYVLRIFIEPIIFEFSSIIHKLLISEHTSLVDLVYNNIYLTPVLVLVTKHKTQLFILLFLIFSFYTILVILFKKINIKKTVFNFFFLVTGIIFFFILDDLAVYKCNFKSITNIKLFNILEIPKSLFFLDNMSFFFILMNLITFIIVINVIKCNKKNKKKFFLLIILFVILTLLFCTVNLFIFYILFELSIIPLFLFIGLYGSRLRRIKASLYLFIYSAFGSLLMLFGIIKLYFLYNTLNYLNLFKLIENNTETKIIWLCILIGLLIKVPTVPLHIWLPEAHVEAPTFGSILLASIILKISSYGIVRFIFFSFYIITKENSSLLLVLFSISIIYCSCIILRQIDIKKIIAYSSIIHMNLSLLGLLTYTKEGFFGFFITNLGHTIISGSLFMLVGIIYERLNTRLTPNISGLINIMPKFTFFFFFFILSNFSFPLTINFIGEILILLAIYIKIKFIFFIITIVSVLFSTIFCIWLFSKICFGSLSINFYKKNMDLNLNEFLILFFLSILTIFFGICTNSIINFLNSSIELNLLIQ